MSGAVTGLEGLLAGRILTAQAVELEPENQASARLEADVEAYKRALAGGRRRFTPSGRTVVSTSERASTGIFVVGSGALGAHITMSADLDHLAAAGTEWSPSGGGSVIRYLQAVHGFADLFKNEWLVADAQQTVAEFVNASSNPSGSAGWLAAAREELAETLADEASLDDDKRKILSDFAASVLEQAVKLTVDAPAIDTDPQGKLHFFWKRGSEGLLDVIRTDQTIHFFGSSNGESFRSDYILSGKAWRSHLEFYLRPLRSDAAA